MRNARKIFWFLGVLTITFVVLEIGTTESKAINQESSRIDTEASGANGIPDYLKDDEDDLNGGSERGSGEVLIKEKPKPVVNTGASVFADKQVDKLIQAEDLGKGESEASGDNAIPQFKEADDGSGEVIDMDSTKEKEISDNTPTTIQTSQTGQTEQPVILTGGQTANPQTSDAAIQPSAQVFGDNTGTAQTQPTYNYATAPAADQTQSNAAQTAVPADQTAQSYVAQNTLPADQASQQAYAAQGTQPVDQSTQQAYAAQGSQPVDQSAQQSYAAQGTQPVDQSAQQAYAAQGTQPVDQSGQQAYAAQGSQPVDQSAQQAYAPQTQEQAQYYNAQDQSAPASQYSPNAAPQSDQVQQAPQPAAQEYNDASQQTNQGPEAQYYNTAASQATAPAQPDVQAYSSETAPQQQQQVPQPIDAAMEASPPGPEANQYTTNPSQVFNNANGVPQSVDAASISQPQQQTQYYASPEQQTMPQQPAANDLTSSFMAASNQPQMDYANTAYAATQQPMQYTSQAGQDAQNTQAYQESATTGVQQRKIDVLDENKFRTIVCQNNQDMITCPQGRKINVVDAHYGSMGLSDCQGPQANFLPIQPCETPGALNVVKTNCDDMDNCMLSANDGLFGSQCESDKKYLDVTYKCEDDKESQQYMNPGYQNPYANQASPYGQYQDQAQQQSQEPAKITPPPPPKIPELMSTLVQLSKNNRKTGSLNDMASCSSCNKCSQCFKSARCGQCGFCQSKLCDKAAAALPMIPDNLRPLWEQWNEKTADMNSMEMSALILAPPKSWKKKLTKKSAIASKRSHINKHAAKKTHKDDKKKHS